MEIQNILGYMLNVSAKFIKRKMNREIEKYDLTTKQWAVIRLLYTKKELTQVQIADELKADRATAGNVILNLYKKKYVDRISDENDRRVYKICLTPKAQDIVKKVDVIARNVTDEALKGLKEDDIKVLYYSLNKIINNLSER